MNFIEKNTKKVALILGIATAVSAVTTVYAASNTDGWHNGVYLVDGKVKTSWLFEETGEVYYLNSEGAPVKGWRTIDDNTYYFNANGERVSGNVVIDGYRYTFQKNGKLLLGWQDDNTTYYNEFGVRITGKQKIDGKTYYFNEQGIKQTGWIKVDNKKVYFTKDGSMATSKVKINGEMVTFNKDGSLKKGWSKKDGEYYYYQSGVLTKGWKKINGKQYFFNKKGQALTNTKYKGYSFNKKGVATKIKKKKAVQHNDYNYDFETSNTYAGSYVSNDGIANAALAQVGVAQDCTMLATNALAAQGIYFHGWPWEYKSLGTVTSNPQAGDLIYYDDGGVGLAHIAVYIGNGQAVHGGYHGSTVVASAYTGSAPVFIHVGK